MHFAQRARAQDLRSAHAPFAKLRRRELRHVLDGRRDAGGGRHAARVDERVDAPGPVGHQPPVTHGQTVGVSVHARGGHAERLVDVLLDVVRPLLSAHGFHHEAGHRIGQVGVLPADVRRERRLAVGHQPAQLLGGGELERRPVRTRLTRETGAVGQEFLDRNRRILGLGGLHREPGQILLHGVIEAQLALLAQLHHGRRGEELAVRCHAEFRLRRHGRLRRGVGQAEALRPHEILVGHDAHGHARKVAVQQLAVEPCAEQANRALHVGVAHHIRRRRRRPHRRDRSADGGNAAHDTRCDPPASHCESHVQIPLTTDRRSSATHPREGTTQYARQPHRRKHQLVDRISLGLSATRVAATRVA